MMDEHQEAAGDSAFIILTVKSICCSISWITKKRVKDSQKDVIREQYSALINGSSFQHSRLLIR